MNQAVDVSAPVSAVVADRGAGVPHPARDVAEAGLPGAATPIDPRETARMLRAALARAGRLPLTVCVTGPAPQDPPAAGSAELADFLRWDVLSRGHRLDVLLGRRPGGGRPGGEPLRAR